MKFSKLIIQHLSTEQNEIITDVEVTCAQNQMIVRTLKDDEYKIKFMADITALEIGTSKLYATVFLDTCRWKLNQCQGIQKYNFVFQ